MLKVEHDTQFAASLLQDGEQPLASHAAEAMPAGTHGAAGKAHVDIIPAVQGVGDLGAGGHVGFVGGAGRHAGARLDAQGVALRLEFFRRLGRDGDAGFADRCLCRNADEHGCSCSG